MSINHNIPVTSKTLNKISELDRFRGQWSSRNDIPPARLARIEEAARIQSVAASSRLSGIKVSDAETAGLLREESIPLNDAKQMRGYAAALSSPFPDAGQLLRAEDLRRLNAVLVGDTSTGADLSPWRATPLHRESFDANGRATGRVFTTLPPWMIEEKIEDLLTWFEFEMRTRDSHPVLVIATFVLCFLAASPFERRNGRMARLMVSRLMQRAGYEYMPYASIESQIEDLRDSYHAALERAETGVWTGQANLEPWIDVFVEIVCRHRERVETKAELEREASDYPPLQQAILQTVREHGNVDAGLLLKATGANRNTLKDNLRRLVTRGVLERTGLKRGTRYRLATVERAKTAAGVRPTAEGKI